jgi:pimeloyl-ACP methyl ester carboxylesterase
LGTIEGGRSADLVVPSRNSPVPIATFLGLREFAPPMNPSVRNLFDLHRLNAYRRPTPLILVNGLAEQSESWFANRTHWSKHFDIKVPEILVYDGDSLHKRIDEGGEITVDYLTDRLADYLDEYVQRPPYDLVGSSLGGQIILTYATRHPKKVSKLVLICPSGLYGDENLPMMEGVRRSQYDTLVKSVFHRAHFASEELIAVIERKFQDRQWKKGVLRTLRGTVGHSVAPLLSQIPHPTMLIWGANDRVISDVAGSVRAAGQILKSRQVVIPQCGHAPQIEKARLVNKLVLRFLRDGLKTVHPNLDPARFLAKLNRPSRPRVILKSR